MVFFLMCKFQFSYMLSCLASFVVKDCGFSNLIKTSLFSFKNDRHVSLKEVIPLFSEKKISTQNTI